MNWRTLTLWIALATLGPSAWSNPSAVDRQALILGISTYPDRQVRPLSAARTDIANARQIASAMGIAPQRMTVLQDAQVTAGALEAQLHRLTQSATPSARLFLYFSGYGGAAIHPTSQACEPGLWMHDGSWVPFQRLHGLLKPLAASMDKVIVLMDAGSASAAVATSSQAAVASPRELVSKTAFFNSAGVKACPPKAPVKSRAQIIKESDPEANLQNLVYVASSMPQQTSWDESDGGAIATQAFRNCILGDAVDLDQSGAVSVDELQVCATKAIKKRALPNPGQDLELVGNRQLIPVVRIEEAGPQALGAYLSSLSTEKIQFVRDQSKPVPADAPMSSAWATLNDIYQQRDPKKEVRVDFQKTILKIHRDKLQYTVRSQTDGYLYVFILGSDAKSFYMLFPNGYNSHDLDNAIGPNRSLTPSPMTSNGPAGTDRLLFIVSEQKLNFGSEAIQAPSKQLEITQSLNTPQGRRALIDLTLGGQSSSRSSRFGAAFHLIQEIP